jgi:hypothetical protein
MTRDWVLVEWAGLANRGQLRNVQVTFQSGGLVLCGTLIGGREYFEGIGQLAVAGLRAAESAGDVTEAFADLYASHAAHYPLEDTPAHRESEGPEYMHFKDVHLLIGGDLVGRTLPLDIPYWRVKIEAVEGFLLGGSVQHLPVSSVPPSGDEEPTADRDD